MTTGGALLKISCGLTLAGLGLTDCATTTSPPEAEAKASYATPMDERIAHYAQVYEVPEELIRRSIRRESGYNPKARNGPYWGLMQIRVDTAKGMGYHGAGKGLLDADTNLKYACAYLSNAYKVAEGDANRAIALYAHGYYYEARRKGMLSKLRSGETETPVPAETAPAPTVEAQADVSEASVQDATPALPRR